MELSFKIQAVLLNPRREKAFYSRQRSKQSKEARNRMTRSGEAKKLGWLLHRVWAGPDGKWRGKIGRHLAVKIFKCHDDFGLYPLVQ